MKALKAQPIKPFLFPYGMRQRHTLKKSMTNQARSGCQQHIHGRVLAQFKKSLQVKPVVLLCCSSTVHLFCVLCLRTLKHDELRLSCFCQHIKSRGICTRSPVLSPLSCLINLHACNFSHGRKKAECWSCGPQSSKRVCVNRLCSYLIPVFYGFVSGLRLVCMPKMSTLSCI